MDVRNWDIKKSVVALIPARAGSKRVKNKNIRVFCGYPLIAYTIRSAIDSGVFDRVVVSTESEHIEQIARYYGADVPGLRKPEYATDTSPDFEWIAYTMERLRKRGKEFEHFAILRPTSPFRMPETIQRAWAHFSLEKADSLRAVEKCSQHPYKMWVLDEDERLMKPFVTAKVNGQWGHSSPYQALPEIYVQNASLEISKTSVLESGAITGESVIPFITEGYEGFDINTELDWMLAEKLVADGLTRLPNADMRGRGS